ncbi:hypothetical protein V6N13_078621 [Hibiscus sabdariffa]
MKLQGSGFGQLYVLCLAFAAVVVVKAEDPYRFFNWNITYGDISPLGFRQQILKAVLDGGHKLPSPDGILINGRGPGGASFTVEQGKTYSKVGTAQTKAAMAISSRVLAEMEIPTAHFEDLPKSAYRQNGKARRKFSSSALICQHSGIANRIEAAVHVWKQKDQRKHMNQHQSLAL